MVARRSGLGRNLSALLSQMEPQVPQQAVLPTTLAIQCLQPGKYQPRGEIEESGLAELAASIKKQGLLQPIVVRPITQDTYEIIAGERRWRACQLAEMLEVPVVVRAVDDETAMAMALVENLQREDLNAMDQARAMHRLTTEFALTHQQVADLLSKSRTAVTNHLRLLNLSPEVRRMLEYGDLEMGHARCLLMLEEEQQSQVAKLVVARNLSVRETEALVARTKAGRATKSITSPLPVMPQFEKMLETLSSQLAAKVSLKPGRGKKGCLLIHYDTAQDLESMMSKLLQAAELELVP